MRHGEGEASRSHSSRSAQRANRGNAQGNVIITGDGNVVTFESPPRGETAPEGRGIDTLYPALLRIRGQQDEPVGLGFLVSPRTALTCAHVVKAASAPGNMVRVDFPFLSRTPP